MMISVIIYQLNKKAMSKPNDTCDKKVISDKIYEFYLNNTGEFHGLELWRYCLPFAIKRVYPDTVLRYMRELREKQVINYKQVGQKSDSLYRIVKPEN